MFENVPLGGGTKLPVKAIVVVDKKGRVLLSKELRKASGVQKNDHLIAKSPGRGKIVLEKAARQPRAGNEQDPLDWLLSHPAKIRSARLRRKVEAKRSTRELIESWKRDLWSGD